MYSHKATVNIVILQEHFFTTFSIILFALHTKKCYFSFLFVMQNQNNIKTRGPRGLNFLLLSHSPEKRV